MTITLEGLALFISVLISLFGLVTALIGLFGLIKCKSCTPIEGEIVDFIQEYTSRGFLWKAKVRYELNGKEYFYITRARTTQHGTQIMTLYSTEKGKIIEKGHSLALLLGGICAFIMAVVLFVLCH